MTRFFRTPWIRAAGGLLFLLLWASASPAQTYREGLPVPSLNLNRQLLLYAQAGDPEKIGKILQMARPLTDNIKNKYGVDIEGKVREAMNSGDAEELVEQCRRLVYLDTRDLMDSALESLRASSPKAQSQWKAAFLNYLLLSPYLKSVNSPADQSIRDGFRGAGQKMDPDSASETGAESFQKIVSRIDTDLKTALALAD